MLFPADEHAVAAGVFAVFRQFFRHGCERKRVQKIRLVVRVDALLDIAVHERRVRELFFRAFLQSCRHVAFQLDDLRGVVVHVNRIDVQEVAAERVDNGELFRKCLVRALCRVEDLAIPFCLEQKRQDYGDGQDERNDDDNQHLRIDAQVLHERHA